MKDNVILGTDAKVLGPIEIGENARIGAGSVVLHTVPAGATVVGIPARVVIYRGKRLSPQELNHDDLPDPVAQMLNCQQNQVDDLKVQLENLSRSYKAKHREVERSDQAV